MKSFFSSFLGSFTALILFVFGGGLLLFLGVLMAASFGEQPQATVKSGSYLVFDLSTNITDAPAQIETGALIAAFTGGDVPSQLQTRLVTRALHEAAADDRIEGMLIKGSFAPQGYGTSFAALQEVRRALEVFKKSGKPIRAYLQYADTRDFYIASVADDLALDPNGMVLCRASRQRAYFSRACSTSLESAFRRLKWGSSNRRSSPTLGQISVLKIGCNWNHFSASCGTKCEIPWQKPDR